MSPTLKELGIDRMSAEQRVNLALEIWESLGEGRAVVPLAEDDEREINRREAELDAHPELALSWEEIRASIEGGK